MRAVCGSILVFALSLSLLPPPAKAADPVPPAGFWKLSLPGGDGKDVILMLAFSEEDGKWTGDYLMSSAKLVAEPKFTSLKVNGDSVQFTMEFKGREFVNFDGVVSKDKKKLSGSFSLLGGELRLTDLYPTKLRKIDDPFELARETLTQVEGGQPLFDAATQVLSRAGAKKLPADEARAILDRVNKAAAAYGPRWERENTLRLAGALAGQDGLGDVAVAQAKRAERLLTDNDDAALRLRVLEAVNRALVKSGKADDAKTYAAQIAKLEARDYAEYAKNVPLKAEPFPGRKGKSDRAVLIELFTGAECMTCPARDVACDALLKAYKPTEVIVLQYHLPLVAPDPMMNDESMKRAQEYYRDQVEGPAILVNGKGALNGGGPASAAAKLYPVAVEAVNEILETPAGAKLGLAVAKAEKGGFTVKATVDLAAAGEKVEKTTLRFALAEERVRYAGGNGIRYHHMVVRAMPGGQKGFPLTKKTSEETIAIDPEEVRRNLTKYLEDFTKNDGDFPRPDRPLELRNLKLIAFVQNDATHEILQAVQADLDAK